MTERWEADPEWKAYVTRVRTDLVPMVSGSGVGISVVPRDPKNVDVKFAVELGLLIMFDKPIILVVEETTVLPHHLERVADHIVRGNINDPAVQAALQTAIDATRPVHE